MFAGSRVLVLALGVLLLFMFVPASAQAAADTAGKWGLLATWAPDCSAPPSRENTHNRYVRQGELLVLERDGGDYRDSNTVIRATPAADGAIAITIDFEKFSQVRTILLVRGMGGRIRVMSNHDDKGSYSVKEGKLLSDGAPTPWQSRC